MNATPRTPDLRDALRSWLRHAVAAYGEELPVPIPGRIVLPRPVSAAATPTVEPTAASVERGAGPAEPGSAPTGAVDPPTEAESTAVTTTEGPEADLPQDLDALRRIVTTCRRCKLCDHRTQTVFGEGARTAAVMFVGEAPGAREDEQGRPFVGPAGRLLTRIIENAMGLRREDVYIANVNKCRPPGNRNPEPDEIAACLPFLRAQIRLVRPRVLVALGRVAAHNLLGTSLSMAQLRQRELSYDGVPVVATWHPAYLLRTPEAKRETWDDIKRVNRLLGRPADPRRAGA